MGKSNFYNQGVNWKGTGNYYIHYHQEHIGRMNPGTDVGEGKIYNTFNKIKKDNASAAIKTQYKAIFLHNVNQKDYDVMNQLFSDNNADSILKTFNDAIKQELQDRVNVDKIEQALKYERSINWDEAQLNKAIKNNNAFEALDTLNSLLENLAEGVKLINYKESDIAKVLIAAQNNLNDISTKQKTYSLQKFGKELRNALAEKEIEWNNKPVSITRNQILEAIGEIKKLTARFETLQKDGVVRKKDEPLTADAIKKFTETHLFSTLVGETIPTHMKNVAMKESLLAIKKGINDISGTGKDTMVLQPTLESGEFDPDNNQWDQARQIKSDIRFNNVGVDLSLILGPDYSSITMGLGVSNKAYKTKSFGKSIEDFGNQTFSAGGGMNVEHAFQMLTSNSYIKYLGYNVFARQDTMPLALKGVQDALFTRSIIYLFGSRNIDDFANFMLINGQFISLWDIITYAVEHNIGYSRSQADSSQGIVISMGSSKVRGEFGKYLNEDADNRTKHTNEAIKKAGLHAYIRPAQLIKAIQKS